MVRRAVPIFPGHVRARRPSRADLLKAACPRDLDQLPGLFLGIAVALFVLGHALATAHISAAVSLQGAAAVFFGGFLAFHAVTWLLVKVKWIDKSQAEAVYRQVAGKLTLPRPMPAEDARVDTSYAPAAAADASVQANVAQAVARRTGAKVVFDTVRHETRK